MIALISRALGGTLPSRLGSVLMLAGMGLVLYSVGAYIGLLPGGYASVPEPVALSGSGQRSTRLESAEAAPVLQETSPTVPAMHWPSEVVQSVLGEANTPGLALRDPPLPPSNASATSMAATVPIKLEPADAIDRREAALWGRPGFAVRLKLPSIQVDTEVKPGGVITNQNGELEWETVPFVAVMYTDLGPVGKQGNPVITGHVVTLREGNVFRDLYKVELGEPVEVYTGDSHFTYIVDEIKLVPPTAVEVMAPTDDARLTLITCGGTFDPRTRTFSDRLVVIGKLAAGERL